MFGMTGKQLIMLSGGAAAALAFTAVLKASFDMTLFASFLFASVPTLAPVAFCAFYKKNGMSFGQIAKIIIRHKVRRRQIRLYRTRNFYFQLAERGSAQGSHYRRERFNGKTPAHKAREKSRRAKKH
jgi:hypothetical protein